MKKLPDGAVVKNSPPSLFKRYKYYIAAFVILAILSVCLILAYFYALKRSIARARQLLGILPSEICVIGKDERILYWKGFESDTESDKTHYLREIPFVDYDLVSAAVAETFKNGESRIIEYRSGDSNRAISMAKIPFAMYGREAVAWVALDNTELIKARAKADEYAAKLRRTTKLWDLVINSLPIHVFAKNPDDGYKYIFCNKAMADFFGTTEEKIVGKIDSEIFPPQAASEICKLDREIMAGIAAIPEQTAFTPDSTGQMHSLRGIKKSFVDEDGSRLLFGIAIDITELQELKRRAEENSEWFKRTLNSIGDGVITTDKKGRIVMINPVAERMLGCPKENVIGRPHEDVFHIERYDDGMPAPSPLTRTLRTGTIVELANHTDLISATGERYHISDSAAPILDKDGSIIGAILVFRDVTEEYIQRDTLRNTVSMMEAGAEVTNSATFVYDVKTKKMSGSKLLSTLWPSDANTCEGFRIWVLPEDQKKLVDAWIDLREGKQDSILVDYRIIKNGEIRYCRLKSYVDERKRDSMKTFGAIQDITEITSSARHLRENTELWEQIINLIPTMIGIKDFNDGMRYILCNKSFADFIGKSPDEIIGKNDTDLLYDISDAEYLRNIDKSIEKPGTIADFHEIVANCEGKRVNLSTRKCSVNIGERKLLIAAISDISDLSNRIELEKINSDILSHTVKEDNIDNVLEYIAKILIDRVKCDRLVLVNFNAKGETYMSKEWMSEGLESVKNNIDEHYRAWNFDIQALRENRIISIADAQNDPVVSELKKNPKYQSHSMLIAPILVGGDLWGALFLSQTRNSNAFSEIDENLVRTCSNVIALAEIRNRQTKALYGSDFEKQTILNNIRIPVWLFDGDGKLLRANKEVEKMSLGISGNDKVEWFGKYPEYDRPVARVIRNRTPVTDKIDRNGHDFIVNAQPVFDSSGKLVYIVKSAFDVTDLNRLLRQQSISKFCLEVFFREENVENAFGIVMERVCKFMNASRMFMIQLDSQNSKFGTCMEYSSTGKEKIFELQNVPFNPDAEWFKSISSGKMVCVPDIDSPEGRNAVLEWGDLMKGANIRSIYSISLHCGNKLWGNFGVMYENEQKTLSAGEIDFLKTVARQVNLLLQKQFSKNALLKALEDARRSEHSKETFLRNEKTLNSCLQELFTEENTENAIHSVLNIIMRHFSASKCYIMKISVKESWECVDHEEVAQGFIPSGIRGVRRPLDKNAPWFKHLLENSFLFLPDMKSEESLNILGEWREDMKKMDVHSLIIAPVKIDGEIWGDIGVMYQGRKCDHSASENIDLLVSAAQLIEVMLQRQKSREQIVGALEQAQAADKAKSFFIASVSHEIRTPLNAILGFSELLKSGNVGEAEAKDYLNSINLSGNALLQLINDVLDLSKLEANQLGIVEEAVDFNAFAGEISKVFAYRAASNGVELKLSPMDIPILMLDSMRIRQILFNLIGNAIKFTPKGSITISASFTPKDNEMGEFRFSVADTGIGISAADKERIMEPFIQLSKMRGTNASNNGTGLGLAISKRLAEKMGGKLNLESEEGKGSVFEVVLNNIRISNHIKTQNIEKAQIQSGEKGYVNSVENLSVLLVDDVPMNLKIMAALCKKAGICDIVTVANGEKAISELAKRKFEVVMTDMWMPGINGEELAKKIRRDGRYNDVAVIAVTADVEIRDNFKTEYFDEVLFKPVTLEKIRRAVLKKRDSKYNP